MSERPFHLLARLERYWRLLATALSFISFGVGGLLLSVIIFPAVHIFVWRRSVAQKICRRIVQLSFKMFLHEMQGLGAISYDVRNKHRLDQYKNTGVEGCLILPNHPSLIDVILTIAHLPDAYCIVKSSHWKNPFLFGIMRATGYLANTGGQDLVDDCVALLRNGHTLVMFPEGTRTKPNKNLRLQKGAVVIAFKAQVPIIPAIIKVDPPYLYKDQPWYDIPEMKSHFSIDIHEPVALFPEDQKFVPLSKTARQANRKLLDYYYQQLRVKEDIQVG